MFHRDDYYLAQIAKEIRSSRLTTTAANKLRTSDFLVKFEESNSNTKEEDEISEEDKAQQLAKSKAYWGSLAGVKIP